MAGNNVGKDLFSKIKDYFGDQIKEHVKMINSNTDQKTAEIKNSLEEIKKDIST